MSIVKKLIEKMGGTIKIKKRKRRNRDQLLLSEFRLNLLRTRYSKKQQHRWILVD